MCSCENIQNPFFFYWLFQCHLKSPLASLKLGKRGRINVVKSWPILSVVERFLKIPSTQCAKAGPPSWHPADGFDIGSGEKSCFWLSWSVFPSGSRSSRGMGLTLSVWKQMKSYLLYYLYECFELSMCYLIRKSSISLLRYPPSLNF